MASPFTPNVKNTDLSSSLKKYLKTLQFFTAITQLKKNFPLSTLKKKSLFIWHNDYLGTINELVLKMYYFRVKPREKENSVILTRFKAHLPYSLIESKGEASSANQHNYEHIKKREGLSWWLRQ